MAAHATGKTQHTGASLTIQAHTPSSFLLQSHHLKRQTLLRRCALRRRIELRMCRHCSPTWRGGCGRLLALDLDGARVRKLMHAQPCPRSERVLTTITVAVAAFPSTCQVVATASLTLTASYAPTASLTTGAAATKATLAVSVAGAKCTGGSGRRAPTTCWHIEQAAEGRIVDRVVLSDRWRRWEWPRRE
eukprot:874920-Pleurochrysis_carterae.AAC.2